MNLRAGLFSLLTVLLIAAISTVGSIDSMNELAVLVTRIFLGYCTIIACSQLIYALSNSGPANKDQIRVRARCPRVAAEGA